MNQLANFLNFVAKSKIKKGVTISKIRSDHERELENKEFEHLCDQNGFEQNFVHQGLLNKIGLFKKI